MQRILSAEQMRLADKYTIEKLGVSEDSLVERAGGAVAEEIVKRFRGGRVLVCIGNGNNGADGKVIANILSNRHGFSVATINVSNGIFKLFDKKYDIIVDCIFGTGLNREIEGKYKLAIEKINNSGAFIVSCDIPSGINGNNGNIMGVAVKANLTVAIQELKLGHFLGDGIDYSGQVVAKDIGISIWEDDCVKRLNNSDVLKYFLPKKRISNKGNFGKCVIIGGSKNYSGSAVLSMNALSALKMGVGYSTLVVPNLLFGSLVGVNPECILNSFSDDGENIVFKDKEFKPHLKASCISIGMGMGVNADVYQTVLYFLENYDGTLIIDADGLNSLSKYGVDVLRNKKCRVVLTPHIMEFSRLTGIDKQTILSNPIKYAKEFANKYQVIVALKSAVSVITDGNQVYLNTTGCVGMAKAGSGDVLSGIMTGIIARSEDVLESTAVSCYVFGKAGEFAQREMNQYTMTASDIVRSLTYTIDSLSDE